MRTIPIQRLRTAPRIYIARRGFAAVKSSAALALICLVQACGGPSEAELIASAKTYIASKNQAAAIVQLKSALQKKPDSGEARFLLGKTLLDAGDAAGASVELRKAAEVKFDDVLVIPALATALVRQGQDLKVTESYGESNLGDAAAAADLKTTLALAYLRQSKREPAEKALADALKSVPRYVPAELIQARLLADKGNFPAAMALLDDVTTRDATNAGAWLTKGELQQLGLHDNAAALISYRKAVAQGNDLMKAHEGIVTLLLEANDLDAASAHVDALKKALPKQPVTQFLDAEMAFLRKDYQATRAITQPLLQATPNNALLLQLAGAAEFQLRAFPQAKNLLALAVNLAPGLQLARQLLAQAYLRTGEPEKALDTLRPFIESNQPRPDALTLAGEAYLQVGDARRAEEMFTKATKVKPGYPRARLALALSQIGNGNAAGGMAELEALSASGKDISADLALISAHLRRKEFDKALKAIDGLERKQPDRALASVLRGRLLALRHDSAGARASFEHALAIEPGSFVAVAGLAALDLSAGQPDVARKRFEDQIHADPKNYRAMLALADLLTRTSGSPAEIESQLAAAVKAAPSETAPRLQLVNHDLAVGNAKLALAAAQESVAALPESRDLLHALGRAQLASADFQQAITTFNKLAKLMPSSPLASLGLADAYVGLKDYDAVERSLKRALEITPKLVAAQHGLLGLLTGDGRYQEALTLAHDVQKQRPAEATGYEFEGEVELSRRHWDAAIAALRTGLQKSASAESALRLHQALAKADRQDDAERFAASWLKDHPQDGVFRFYLGDLALGSKDWALAETRYREVLRLQPENPLALNNVAWLLLKQAKPGALPFAEKASTLAPGQPALQDTLAMALAAEKQLPRALELQKKTIERAPNMPALHLTLARLYLQSGDKAQARAELEKLTALGQRTQEQREAAELLKTI